jgi:Sulfotransferase domain
LAGRPNFFIVGAPKCGTTTLYEYLRPHPNIFMPELKEPHFFSTDLVTFKLVDSMADYLALFAPAGEAHRRVGEASASYLLSSAAIPAIREFSPDARLIAMYRNPVDLVYSFHSQLLYWAEETETDFETAWRLQERRRQGLDLPRTCREPFWLQYERIGQFGTQTERLLATFPRDQVKLILSEDFAASPQTTYDEVLAFLGVPHDGRTEFPRFNEHKRAKMTWLRNFVRKPPPFLRTSVRALKRRLGAGGVVAVKRKIVDLNTVKEQRPPLRPEFRAELVATFRDEVARFSRLAGRDLSHWT